MRRMNLITQEEVKERFEYREDGGLYYRYDINYKAKKGQRFGWESDDGRRGGYIKGKVYREHRLIFLYFNNFLPDHIDNDPRNNKIENLRECTISQNAPNAHIMKEGTSKYKGVFKDTNTWRASVSVNNVRIWLGSFVTEIEVAIAYDEAPKKYHGEFGLTNEISK